MVPADFLTYFAATAAAAGVLIGLLFVAISLRPDAIPGEKASVAAQAVSGSAFTALVNSFMVSLIALIPGTGLGWVAATLAVISLVNTIRLHLGLTERRSARTLLLLSTAAYVAQLVVGGLLALAPSSRSLVTTVAYLMIASFAVALSRAWSLVRGEHLIPALDGQAARDDTAPDDTGQDDAGQDHAGQDHAGQDGTEPRAG